MSEATLQPRRSNVDTITQDSGRVLVRLRMWANAQSTPPPDHAEPTMTLILVPDEAEETGQALVKMAQRANQSNAT